MTWMARKAKIEDRVMIMTDEYTRSWLHKREVEGS